MTFDSLVFVETSTNLNDAALPGILSSNGVGGLSYVANWDDVETSLGTYTWADLQTAWNKANAAGKKLHYRIRAGKHTPSFRMGDRTWVPNSTDPQWSLLNV